MFILIRKAGRSITLAWSPTREECERADVIVQVGKDGVTVIKNRSVVGEREAKIACCVRDALDYLLTVQEVSLREPFLIDELPVIIECTDKAVTRLLVARAEEEK